MTEQAEASPPTSVRTGADTDSRPSVLRWLIGLVLIAAIAGGGAWLYVRISGIYHAQIETLQGVTRDINALEVQGDRLESRQNDMISAAHRNANELADLGSRIEAHDQIVGQLKEDLVGGRAHFELAAIEQLLLLANDRLQLARDVSSAVVAVDEADARLAALRDPRLFPVRQELAREKAALQAVPLPDYGGAALTLSSLIDRAPRLPLRARAESNFTAAPAQLPVTDDASWYQRAGASIREALSNIFTVHRDSGPSPRLLDAEQEALVVQVLALKLEGARVALLRGDTTSFRDLCDSASEWLDTYFRKDDPGVAAAHAELERLQPLDLSPPLPDISRSLGLLRTFMRSDEQS